MSKDKQIEEMALTEVDILANDLNQHCADLAENYCGGTNCLACLANALYNKGYRKQSEGEWEIVKGSHGKEIMVCTNCRHSQDLHSTFTYCPNCGARMKGGGE